MTPATFADFLDGLSRAMGQPTVRSFFETPAIHCNE
jgi:hypothetical protein